MSRMRLLVLAGVALLVLGILSLAYDRFVLEGTEQRALGPFTVEVPTRDEIRLPRPLGWALVAAGAISLGAGLYSRPKG
jgi:hypothetical protein